ncbi:MAG: SEC-C metal-binding domain-containing protein [Thermodesulfobacteriota bacterium]
MSKIGRNTPCPCGSGKKYKKCCEKKEGTASPGESVPGRLRHEPGSYGGPDRGYMPSILCYKEVGAGASWEEHLCLVQPDIVLPDEEAAGATAIQHLDWARQTQVAGGGSPERFAAALSEEGYKRLADFRVAGTASAVGHRRRRPVT